MFSEDCPCRTVERWYLRFRRGLFDLEDDLSPSISLIMKIVLLDKSKTVILLSGTQQPACLNSLETWFLVRPWILDSSTTITHLHIGLAALESFWRQRKINCSNTLHIVHRTMGLWFVPPSQIKYIKYID